MKEAEEQGIQDHKPALMRPKIWPESNTDERLESLRNEVVAMRVSLAAVQQQLRMLVKHSHVGNLITVPIEAVVSDFSATVPMGLRSHK